MTREQYNSDGFRVAMRAAGLDYAGPLPADGKLHRFKAEADKARNSWFVFFPQNSTLPASGAFGCWRLGIKETFCAKVRTPLSDTAWQALREGWKLAEEQREKTEVERHLKARRVAAWILARSTPATTHAYLADKQVQPHGDLREYRGALVLPMRDATGELHSLQFIGADGAKRFLTGGRIAGCFFTVADKADGPLVVCEGYATGASIHEATGYAVTCAMNCHNLKAVAESLPAKWPAREMSLAADNDQWTDGNPGLTKATEAAKAIGAKLACPQFKEATMKPTDFNDLARLEGLAAVKAQLAAADTPKETDADTFARLSRLPPADYDRARGVEAERLGIRASTLDAEVAKYRPVADASRDTQGKAVELPTVEPWPDPVNGAELLCEVHGRFVHYLALPDGAADACTLWVAFAHAFEAFSHSPRLNLRSPEKGCGKTLCLDVIGSLTPRPLRTESLTAAVLFRLVDAHKPTLLLDEVDAYLSEAEELRGLLNAGHKRGACAYRCEGDSNTVRAFKAFSPAVLAGIGALPGTLHDRSIIIKLVRAKPGEVAARFDSRRVAYETELRRKLARWTADNFAKLETCDPKLPEGAFNRLADNWRPLLAIAEAARGDWPARALAAFAKLTGGDDLDAQGIGALVLRDIADAFKLAEADKLPSAKLAEALAAIEGRPWAEWGKSRKPISPNSLAILLRRFTIAPRTIKLATGDTAKGYHRDDFSEAFARFLPDPPFQTVTAVTTPANIGDSALSETSPAKSGLRSGKAISPNKDGHGYGVTFQKGGKPVEMALEL